MFVSLVLVVVLATGSIFKQTTNRAKQHYGRLSQCYMENRKEHKIIRLKVCDDGTLVQILCFWTVSIVLSSSKKPSCLFFRTQRFGDWILSPSSGKTYSLSPEIGTSSID
jgi:hypothetical protein